MKTFSRVAMLLAVVALGTYVWADHHENGQKHSNWFDSESCEICKPWHEAGELMKVMQWETHATKRGMLMVASVPEDQLASYNAVCKKMDATIAKMEAGKHMPKSLCGFCTAMGGLKHAGAEMEKIKTKTGDITLVTSDKEATVKQIHQVAKRTQEEAKKLEEMMMKIIKN